MSSKTYSTKRESSLSLPHFHPVASPVPPPSVVRHRRQELSDSLSTAAGCPGCLRNHGAREAQQDQATRDDGGDNHEQTHRIVDDTSCISSLLNTNRRARRGPSWTTGTCSPVSACRSSTCSRNRCSQTKALSKQPNTQISGRAPTMMVCRSTTPVRYSTVVRRSSCRLPARGSDGVAVLAPDALTTASLDEALLLAIRSRHDLVTVTSQESVQALEHRFLLTYILVSTTKSWTQFVMANALEQSKDGK